MSAVKYPFDPNRSDDEKRKILRETRITRDMTYEERLRMQMLRHGLI